MSDENRTGSRDMPDAFENLAKEFVDAINEVHNRANDCINSIDPQSFDKFAEKTCERLKELEKVPPFKPD